MQTLNDAAVAAVSGGKLGGVAVGPPAPGVVPPFRPLVGGEP